MEEIINELKEAGWQKVFDNKELNEKFSALWSKVFKEQLCRTCKGGFAEKFNFLTSQNNQKITEMSNRKFIPKSGILIHLITTGEDITSMTMTDEKAVEILKVHKGYIAFFESFPPDWEELVSGKKKAAATPEPKKFDFEKLLAESRTLKPLQIRSALLNLPLIFPKDEWSGLNKKADLVAYIETKA